MGIASYENLVVWQKSMDLVVAVYLVTKKFPREEVYGLMSQIDTLIDEIMRMLNKLTHELKD